MSIESCSIVVMKYNFQLLKKIPGLITTFKGKNFNLEKPHCFDIS